MKIIKPSVEFLGAIPTNYAGALKFIEAAGRTCYKSEDKITDTSAEPFVKRLIKAGHLAMVEHSNFVVRTRRMDYSLKSLQGTVGKYLIATDNAEYTYVGGSITAWFNQTRSDYRAATVFRPFLINLGMLFGECYLPSKEHWQVCPHNEIPKELHRYSARFICDRGVSHELVRHRPTAMDWYSEFVDSPLPVADHRFLDASFAQESTRYVNYGGKDMEFIEPVGFEDWPECSKAVFRNRCSVSEQGYKILVEDGLKPQQARAVLPNALKTEIVVTADAAEWRHIKNLRADAAAHPDMRRVMNMMPWEEFL